MKKLLNTKNVVFFTCAISLAICKAVSAQSVVFAKEPQWKFWLAFENADGQRDTVYFVFDSTATEQADTLLGEYPVSPDGGKFQVFYSNGIGGDSLKVFASSVSTGGATSFIQAINDSYPLIVRWDTTLFTSNNLAINIGKATLSNTYTLLIKTDHKPFNMLVTDSIVLPAYMIQGQPASHFGMEISVGEKIPNLIAPTQLFKQTNMYPNPFRFKISIECEEAFDQVELIAPLSGQCILRQKISLTRQIELLKLENILQGIYILKITNSQTNQSYYEKIIKY